MKNSELYESHLIITAKTYILKYTKLLQKQNYQQFVALFHNILFVVFVVKVHIDNRVKMYSMYSFIMHNHIHVVQSNHECINTTHIFIYYVMQ